jgi:hypothetical protein
LSSAVEQIAHTLQDKGVEIRHLNTSGASEAGDPEEDPGSVATIYKDLMSTLPTDGLEPSVLRSKERAIRDIAADVGLANIVVAKARTTSELSSLDALREYIDVDLSVELSEAAKVVLGKWCEVAQPAQRQPITPVKRRRVRIDAAKGFNDAMSQRDMLASQPNVLQIERPTSSQSDGMTQITMSQPVPGRHGTRNLRRRPRKSGF